jgi:hypothetical protein
MRVSAEIGVRMIVINQIIQLLGAQDLASK